MKITSQEIRDKLNKMWPNLEYIFLWDQTYWMVSPDAARAALKASSVPTMDFITEFNDCDDFSLQFHAECRRKRYFQYKAGNLPEQQRFPIAEGEAFGDMWRGISKVHKANVILCSDNKIYMIDATPMENRIWEADPANDNILFVSM